MTRQQSTLRRTSQYTLTVPAPEHGDADLQAALDALVSAVAPVVVTGSYITRPPEVLRKTEGARPTLSVAWRADSDLNARVGAVLVCKAYGTDPETASLHTGYGMHRRDFPVLPVAGA